MQMIPYINLAGNAEEVLNFYKGIFGGESEIMRWGEMPPNPHMPVSDERKNQVMHGALTISDDVSIYMADSLEEGISTTANRVVIHINCDTEEEIRRVYAALSDGGTINMPLDNTFWGALYGDFTDKYGIGWGLHYQLPE